VHQVVAATAGSCSWIESRLLALGNGKFQDVSAKASPDFQKAAPHRGLALGGLDNDGRMDAVVTVLNGRVEYFHNISQNSNHRKKFDSEPQPNRRRLVERHLRRRSADLRPELGAVKLVRDFEAACVRSSDWRVQQLE
jgi:hypothetical protein